MSANGNHQEDPPDQPGDGPGAFAKELAQASPPKGVDTIRAAARAVENAEAQKRKESRDAMIRDRAYFLWLENGRPDGRDEEFWLHAEAEFPMSNDH